MSQEQDVVFHLHNVGGITPLDALDKYGCFRLSAIIHNLRNDGYRIQTKLIRKKRKFWAEYSLEK